jgi:hypothetical protein
MNDTKPGKSIQAELNNQAKRRTDIATPRPNGLTPQQHPSILQGEIMECIDNRTAEEIRNEADMKLYDARTILSAIENLFACSAVGEGGMANEEIHTLVLVALDKARQAETLIEELEPALWRLRRAA